MGNTAEKTVEERDQILKQFKAKFDDYDIPEAVTFVYKKTLKNVLIIVVLAINPIFGGKLVGDCNYGKNCLYIWKLMTICIM
jgi:hypothetical protein